MTRLFTEPLLHFILIGAALFAGYEVANPDPGGDSDRRIVVSAGRVDHLASIFARTWQRPPTPEELKRLIDDYVLEEAYYRQGLTMGIDQDDTVIRRRLRQKVEFLTETAAGLVEPSDEQLAAYLSANQDAFREEPRYTFDQMYFNPDRHGDDPDAFVREQLASLQASRPVTSDQTLIPDSFTDAPRSTVDNTFGPGFSAQLDELAPGVWNGPVQSGLGLHLVRLEVRVPGGLPEVAEIRDVVAREWTHAQRRNTRRAFEERMLLEYEVLIEWPNTDEQHALASLEGP